jgi:hypothetical protein
LDIPLFPVWGVYWIPGGGTGDSTGFGVALSQESFAKKFKPITSVAPKTSGSWRDTGPVLIWSSKKKGRATETTIEPLKIAWLIGYEMGLILPT